MPSRELARFLRERREDLRPVDVGLTAGPRRRTPGLRREEVAGLAHMSVDYYARLEQARGPRPSPRILDALTGALRLSAVERAHLFNLVGATPDPPPGPVRLVRPHVVELLHRLPDAAAVVTDATYEVVGWNPLADRLLGGLGARPNLARRRFLEPPRAESTGAEEFGGIAVARLRAAATRYPGDDRLKALLAELRASRDFVDLWDANPLHAPGHRTKTVEHPEVGRVHLNCDVIPIPDDDQQIVFITADPGSPSARALRSLSGAPPDRP